MKVSEVRLYAKQGDYKHALAGAKDFRIGVTDEQRSIMRRAYEGMVHPDFYRQIGIDVLKAAADGIAVLKEVLR